MMKVAFVTRPGVTDNWAGIVYDPSDIVRLAKGHDGTHPGVQELFGGDLVACWRLVRHYYMCSFT